MKKAVYIFILCCLCMGLSQAALAQDKKLAKYTKELAAFLREEFANEKGAALNEVTENTIHFTLHNKAFTLLTENQRTVFYVALEGSPIPLKGRSNPTRLSEAVNAVNAEERVLKLVEKEGNVVPQMQHFCKTANEFMYLFYPAIAILEQAPEKFNQKYVLPRGTKPVEITGMAVGNTHGDLAVIDAYGDRIDASEARFLSPRLTIKSTVDKTITLMVKLVTPRGVQLDESVPDGFTYVRTLVLLGDNQPHEYIVGAWGSEELGLWPNGKYRYEFWSDGTCLYKDDFNLR